MDGIHPAVTRTERQIWGVRHLVFTGLTVFITSGGTLGLGAVLSNSGISISEALLLLLYALLFTWIGSTFLVSAFGAAFLLSGLPRRTKDSSPSTSNEMPAGRGVPRTAIVMPIHNEDVTRVFAGIGAVYESLRAAGSLNEFDFYILSDTTDPEIWLAEERAWFEACHDLQAAGRLFYRHRLQNDGRKSGNIANFCERWGLRYEYMIVLDADSLMSARTLVQMVREMDGNPRLGLLQLWPRPVNGQTLFARIQQYGASVYGRLVAAGLSYLQLGASNYWGHNAVVRVRAFMENCGLPHLPGRPPLGGEILSHDFVEAALLVRAGWEVRLTSSLDGSYEEGPPSLLDHFRRDRRWCQGNLQHARLIFARGLHPMSRLTLFMGVLSYVSAPLWFAFIALSVVQAWRDGLLASVTSDSGVLDALRASPDAGVVFALIALTVAILLLPKVFGLVAVLADGRSRAAYGGGLRAALSVFLEAIFSALVAPTMMIRHSVFVLTILNGQGVSWMPQQREANHLTLREALAAHGLETALGVVLGVIVLAKTPALLWWLSPILAGCVLAAPISAYSSRVRLGRHARRLGLFLLPEEREPPEVLANCYRQWKAASRRQKAKGRSDPIETVIVDPLANALHRALLAGSSRAGDGFKEGHDNLIRRFLMRGIGGLSPTERVAIVTNPELLRYLHVLTWARSRGSRTPRPTLPNAGEVAA